MIDYYLIFKSLKDEAIVKQHFEDAQQFREIERWLYYNHPIEEIFENRNAYNEVVKQELQKIERKKKLEKINRNNE